ncbi:hypothetical protein [Geodermatophilus sp. SYSU D01036]
MRQLSGTRPKGRLAIIVSCTATKRATAARDAMVRHLNDGPNRVHEWVERLDRQPPSQRFSLRSLYGGPMWQSALALESRARGLGYTVDLWVASAGLGLAPVDSSAPAYEASFSAGPDQVAQDRHGRRAWWLGLRTRTFLGRTAADLRLVRDEADQVLLALAPSYLEPLGEELHALAGDEGVAVVSSHRPTQQSPVSSYGLRQRLGGTQVTLNARAAARYLELAGGSPIGSSTAHQRWEEWAVGNRLPEAAPRPPLTDEEVQAFIRECLKVRLTARTPLLTELRRSGSACEQSRFARLYREVQEEQ